MSDTATREVATLLAERIAALWNDEHCSWNAEYQPRSYSNDPYWVVSCEWTDEHSYVHSADYVTYHWQFFGDTADEALAGCVKWLDALAPWKPCGECDGKGAWQGKPCADCNETGLAGAETP